METCRFLLASSRNVVDWDDMDGRMARVFLKLGDLLFQILEIFVSQVDFTLEEVIVDIHFFEVVINLQFLQQVDFHHLDFAILLHLLGSLG